MDAPWETLTNLTEEEIGWLREIGRRRGIDHGNLTINGSWAYRELTAYSIDGHAHRPMNKVVKQTKA
jgi:hypothetical protein